VQSQAGTLRTNLSQLLGSTMTVQFTRANYGFDMGCLIRFNKCRSYLITARAKPPYLAQMGRWWVAAGLKHEGSAHLGMFWVPGGHSIEPACACHSGQLKRFIQSSNSQSCSRKESCRRAHCITC
jgi:hypothetical protein